MAKTSLDDAMKKAAELFKASGKTLEELGLLMGYDAETGRRAAWQFLRKTSDPRLSMLRRFAKALGVSIRELVSDDRPDRPT